MVGRALVLFSLLFVIVSPTTGWGWHLGKLIHGDDWALHVYDEADAMDEATMKLEESVNYVHQYLINMITAAEKAEKEKDAWKKRALLRIVQTRLEELRIGRKEIKRLLGQHRKAVDKVEKHAKRLKKKLPLWHDGIMRKLTRAREALVRADDWLQSEKRIVESEEALLQKHVTELGLYKLPHLVSTYDQAPPGASAES